MVKPQMRNIINREPRFASLKLAIPPAPRHLRDTTLGPGNRVVAAAISQFFSVAEAADFKRVSKKSKEMIAPHMRNLINREEKFALRLNNLFSDYLLWLATRI